MTVGLRTDVPPEASSGTVLVAPAPRGRAVTLLALAAVLALAAAAPALLSTSNLITCDEAISFAVFAVATNLLLGFGGLVSFGQAAFFGTGAYTVALGWDHLRWSFWIGAALAPVVGAVASLVVGAIALRSRRLYFALLTLAFSQLFYAVAEEQYNFTAGANGIFGAMLPASLTSPSAGYYFCCGAALVCLAVLWKVTASPFGLVLRSIRENRERAEALGVNVYRHQLVAFVISGVFCSIAGVLFVVYSQSAYPELLNWTQSGYAVFMSVIGGMYSFAGPALGAFIYTFGQQFLVDRTKDWQLILGCVLLVIVLFRPDGVAGLLSRSAWRPLARRWRRARRGRAR